MRALVYHRSLPRYLLARVLGRLSPRRFFPRLVPLTLSDVPAPRPPAGWVMVRPLLCGICGSDLSLLRGSESFLMEPYSSLPAVLGHEVVAEVTSAPEASEWNPGDRVVVESLLPCEVRGLPPCRFCTEGHYNLCEHFTDGSLAPGAVQGYSRGAGGGMAEAMPAHPSRLVRLPATLSDETAVLVDSLASALQAVLDHFPKDGDTAVIYGSGIIGQHVLRSLRALRSAARIVCIARHPFQGEMARRGGADTVLLAPDRQALAQAVGARFLPSTLGGGNVEGGADIFYDCVGSTDSIQEGLVALRSRGTYVMVGTAGKIGPLDVSSIWFRELRVTGSNCYAQASHEGGTVRTYQRAVDLLAQDEHLADGLLTHTLPLTQYARAFQIAFDKPRHESMKVAIDMRSGARHKQPSG